MSGFDAPRGIEGFRGREPIGAALSVGIKGPSGAPTNTNRFYIVRPVADGKGRDARRAPHPGFARFNSEPSPSASDADKRAHNEARATVRGVLVHAREEDCWTYRRQAQTLPAGIAGPGVTHPKLAPACMGDGRRANRWSEREQGYVEIPCPGAECPYSQRQGNQKAPCGPHGKLLFQLRFENAPSALCKFSSNGHETVDTLVGLFGGVREQAAQLGLRGDLSFYGLPVVLTISRRSNPAQRTGWPVVHVSPDFDEGMTLQTWLIRTAELRRQIVGSQTLLIGSAATLADDSDLEVLADDAMALRPGSVPAPPPASGRF